VRIAYLSGSSVPSKDANAVHVMRMCAAFAAAGHVVDLYALPGSETSDPHAYYGTAGFTVHTVPRPAIKLLGDWIRARRITRDLDDLVPDVVYSRDLRASLLATRGHAPVIYEVHALRRSTRRRRLEGRLFTAPRLRAVVFISAALRDDYLALHPALRDGPDLIVAPDGADAASVDGPSPAPDLGPGSHIGYVGHLYEGRGTGLLLDLAARRPDLTIHLVGGRPEDVERWQVRARSDNVIFHGHVPPSEIASRLRSFDVLVAPYQHQVVDAGGDDTSRWMSPLKVFEYMASSVPMVASDVPVLHEVLEDGRNALLCKPDDVEAWASAIDRLLQDPELARRIAAGARRDLEESFSWARRAEHVLEPVRSA
jgi:glycosyltransferase involved in cell wall biosynthesis